jgi:hypothetical protein
VETLVAMEVQDSWNVVPLRKEEGG